MQYVYEVQILHIVIKRINFPRLDAVNFEIYELIIHLFPGIQIYWDLIIIKENIFNRIIS